jgi:hypothetical protein
MAKLTINIASVKVMRSHDYCHFEVSLAASVDCPPDSPEWYQQVDNLRKNAARLADKAVAQYQIAKAAHQSEEGSLDSLRYAAEQAGRTPESERTPEQKAAIKALADARFAQRHYDYQDDWNDDEQDDY